jgi:hypothetical protein
MRERLKNKQYKYPARMLSMSEEELNMARELKEKYHINISAFFREKLRELYTKMEK